MGTIGSSTFFFFRIRSIPCEAHAKEDELGLRRTQKHLLVNAVASSALSAFQNQSSLRDPEESEARKLLLWVRPDGSLSPKLTNGVGRVGSGTRVASVSVD